MCICKASICTEIGNTYTLIVLSFAFPGAHDYLPNKRESAQYKGGGCHFRRERIIHPPCIWQHRVTQEEILQIESTYEETDNRQILYLFYAKEQCYKYGVVHSPDSDSFFLILYYAHRLKQLTVLLDTGSNEHRCLINISNIAEDFGEEYCNTLLGYYVFTGEHTNSAFRGKGEVNTLNKLQKKQDTMQLSKC